MQTNTLIVHTSRWEVQLAKIYLYCLPFRMFAIFSFLNSAAGPLFECFDAIINILGLLLWYSNEKGVLRLHPRNIPLLKTLTNAIIYLNLSSVFMSIVMYVLYGNHNGRSPFLAIIPMILFYFQYLLMFLYNIRVFSILGYSTIKNILVAVCKILLVLGYIQVVVMHGVANGLYDAIVYIIGGINESARLPKLCLTLSEGASAGCLMGLIVFPFLFARYNDGDKRALRDILWWMPLLFFSHSSTALILFAGIFLIFIFRAKVKNINNLIGVFISASLILLFLLFFSSKNSGGEKETIQYLLFEKPFDDTNGSKISRSVPLILNWGVFTEMPVMGVGNGLQGYFFNKYFPREYMYVEGSDIWTFYEIAQTGIANGGCFFPGYFSGYGIIGMFVLFIVIGKLRQTYKQRKENLGIFGDMFVMGSLAFVLMGMQGEAYCQYYAWFVISIPFMYWDKESIVKGRHQ